MKNLIFIILFALIILLFFIKMEDKEENFVNLKSLEFTGDTEKATFAGGCFWCMEAVFQELNGVVDVVSGYAGGEKENPTYQEVLTGKTGHYETVEIIYDPSKISYEELLNSFWRNIDPVDESGQFIDKGIQYKTAIFYHNETQKILAEESKKELEGSGKFNKPIVTEILPAEKFYKAEEYHQDYYKKRTLQYQIYKKGSGREKRLGEIWE